MELPQLTVLNEQFAIRSVLGELGPFEAVYLAWDLQHEEQVVVREYLPVSLIKRGMLGIEVEPRVGKDGGIFKYGYDRSLQEAVLLEKIRHPNVVRQREHFEENGTIYRVNEYHAGASLEYVIEQQGGHVGARTAIAILVPLLEGLRAGHKHGLIHGGMSPEKIYLSKTGRPMLLSFITTHLLLAQKLQLQKAFQRPGFSPPEHYAAKGKFGPWSDIYSCAATLYYMLTGEALPDVPQRLKKDSIPDLIDAVGEVSSGIRLAMKKGLELNPAKRPQTVEAFRELLVEGAEPPKVFTAQAQTGNGNGDTAGTVDQPASVPQRPFAPQLRESQSSTVTPAAPVHASTVTSSHPTMTPLEDLDFVRPASPANGVTRVARFDPDPPGLKVSAGTKGDGSSFSRSAVLGSETDLPAEEPIWDDYAPRRVNTRQNNRRLALIGVIVVSVVALAFLAYMRWTELGSQEYNIDNRAYQLVLTRGDSLLQLAQDVYATGDLERAKGYLGDARETYLLAQTVHSDDQYVHDQIRLIDDLIFASPVENLNEKEFLALMSRGDSLQRSADALMTQGDSVRARTLYMDARKEYLRVLDLRPGDSLASARVREANQRIATPVVRPEPAPATASTSATATPAAARPATALQMYALYKMQGDSAFESGRYEEARRKFQEALDFKPNDEHASVRLRQIEQRLAEQIRLGQYRQHMSAGNRLVTAGRHAEARREFELALENKPDDPEALTAIASAENSLKEQSQNEELYMSLRTRGDVLFEQQAYDAALESYRAALAVMPGDEYVTGKINQVEGAIAAQPEEEPLQIPEGMIDDNGIYNFAEEPPVLVGGLDVLQARLRYPARAIEAGIEGRVSVRMIVDETGQMVDPEVIKGLGYGCDQEVLRVIRGARFQPGRVGGRPVKVWNTLYFEFKLEDR